MLVILLAAPAHAKVVNVSTLAQLQSAISAAQAGDELVLADGTYAFSGSKIACTAAGSASAPSTDARSVISGGSEIQTGWS